MASPALVARALRAVLDGETPEPAAAPALAALAEAGLVVETEAGWRPGPAIARYARREAAHAALLEAAEPVLRRLAEETGETANLVIPTAGGTESIAQRDGRHLLGATNWIGRPLPLHCTAAGKVFLAFGVSALPDGPLAATAPAAVTDRDQLERELARVREDGYATIVDELEEGLSAAGAPVRDATGAIVAAITVAGATLRLPAARLRTLARLTLEQAQAVPLDAIGTLR